MSASDLIAVVMVVAALIVVAVAAGVVITGEIDLRRHDRTMRQLNERPEEPTDA